MKQEKNRGILRSDYFYTQDVIIEKFEELVDYQIRHNGLRYSVNCNRVPDNARNIDAVMRFKDDVYLTLERSYDTESFDEFCRINMYKGEHSEAIRLLSWIRGAGGWFTDNISGRQALKDLRKLRFDRNRSQEKSRKVYSDKVVEFFIRRIKSVPGFTRANIVIRDLMEVENVNCLRRFKIDFQKNGDNYSWVWDFH